MIAQKTISDIKQVPILDIISRYVTLKKRGANYCGNCPFHEEKTPSFYVHPTKGIYKCFGCGASGDSIEFVKQFEKKTFSEAIELIAGLNNVPFEKERTERTERTTANRICKEIDIIPASLILPDNSKFASNPLTRTYSTIFGETIIKAVLDLYRISVDNDWLLYPQIDFKGNYRTGKSILYKNNGHRDNAVNPSWLHNRLIKKGLLPETFNLKQCFTGEHLISLYPSKTVAIVEGQSTMLFMACLSMAAEKYKIKQLSYFKNFIFICTGGATALSWKEMQVLSVLLARNILLFPDAGFYQQWSNDAEEMQENGVNVAVSDLIENKYTAGILKYNDDLRDYFMHYVNDIKHYCTNGVIQIEINQIRNIPVTTKTGKDFGNLILATIELKDGQLYDVLYSKNGELITVHPKLKELSDFYNKTFQLGKLNDEDCLLNKINNN